MHFPVERVAADAELARDVADVAMLKIQLPEQGLALRSSERIERVHLGPGRRRPRGETVVGRQICWFEQIARAERNHRAQHVAQLADVARPLMGAERVDQILAERYLRRSDRFLGEDMSDERALVLSIGEPRQRQHEALQPIEEILAKLAPPDLLLQLAVRRAHQPDADLDRTFGARRDHFALLQHVQQSSLERIRQVADLVQEQGAAVGLYDFARLSLTGCGSDPSWTTPEQLVLNLSFGHRRAIDRDERLVGALTCGVQGAREKLLAGSRFAEQQHRDVA